MAVTVPNQPTTTSTTIPGMDVFDAFINPEEEIPKRVEDLLIALEDVYEGNGKTAHMEISFFEKSKYRTNYSFATVAKKYTEGTVSKAGFFILLFTETGVDGLTPTAIMEKYRQNGIIEIPSIALDKIVVDISIEEIAKSLKINTDDVIPVSGLIINQTFDTGDMALVVKQASVISNGILEKVQSVGFGKDLDSAFASKIAKLNNLTYDVTKITANPIMSLMGSPRFVEWTVNLKAADNVVEKLNKTSGQFKIGGIYGFIGSLLVKTSVPTVVPGMTFAAPQMVEKRILQPTINISVADPSIPTASSILSLLIGALPVAARWKEIMASNIKAGRNPGALNSILDVDNKAMIGEKPKKQTINPNDKLEKKIQLLGKYFIDMPLITIDIPSYGFGSSFLGNYVIAAKGGNDGKAALDAIIKSANVFTGDETVGMIARDKVFARKTIVIPDGIYINSNGEEAPLDMFDAVRLAEITDDTQLITRFANAMSGSLAAGLTYMTDPFEELCAIYAELETRYDTTITITGTKERIFLHQEFLTAVLEGARKHGLKVIVPDHTATREAITFADNLDLVNAGVDTQTLRFDNGFGGNPYVSGGNPYGYYM